MKHLFLISITFLLMSNTFSQDKVVMRGGDTLNVKISKSTPELIEFTFSSEDIVNVEYKNAIDKIIYASGREEICSSKTQLYKINGIDDWEKVVITYNESDIQGLTRVGQITKTSGWGGAMASGLGYKDALKKIQKEAAKQKASIVLITDKPNEHTTRHGAGVKMTGIAYK
jgi:hypothetical protein